MKTNPKRGIMLQLGVSILSTVVREDLTEQVTFEEGLEGSEEVSQVGISRRAFRAEGIEGPESGIGLAGPSMAKAE